MKPEPRRAAEIFEQALELPPGQWPALLSGACGGDDALRRRVEALLAAHQQQSGFLPDSDTVEASTPHASPELLPGESPGALIGRYKLLEKIGEGGFGSVWAAEQREPVKRRVALKIIKLGMDTRAVVARFEAERQALALMDHPNIAKVLDAGTTDTGRPFFVMELVKGVPITRYCDADRLATRQRLDLFIKVCQAIQHAHQKGIIHRDIKPSNILVTLHDGVPVPKVIDFGIAKATQQELTELTLYTRHHQFIGTPAYMSPEQAEMSGLDIDTRSDIYSLGVLLYELLTGSTPFDSKELMQSGIDAMRRIIREQEPLRPSTRLSQSLGAGEGGPRGRIDGRAGGGADSRRQLQELRGDLDWIVMKCLEKDRTRRYETANGLAADLRRYLENEPVTARPPSAAYRLQKAWRRNRVVFTAGAAVAVALLLGAVASTWQAVRARSAELQARSDREAASLAREQAEAINRFLTEDLLYQATPDKNARERKVTMEEVLGRATHQLEMSPTLRQQPLVEATLRLAVGNTYYKLGLLTEAERHLRRAVELRQATRGPLDRDTLAAQKDLAELLVFGLRRFEEGESLSRQTWEGKRAMLGPEDRETLQALTTYITVLIDVRKLEAAEPLAIQCFRTTERVYGTNDYATICALGNVGYLQETRGNYAGAEGAARDAVQRFERAGLGNTIDAFYAVNNIGWYSFLQGQAGRAEMVLAEALPRAIRVCGPENLVTLHIRHNLARVRRELGRSAEAEALARETLEIRRRVTPGHEGTGRTLLILGQVLVDRQQPEAAVPPLQEALALFRDRYAMKPELSAQAASWLGACLTAQGKHAEAETLLLANPQVFFSPAAAMSPLERRAAVQHIVTLYRTWNKPDQADLWERRLADLPAQPPGSDQPTAAGNR